MSTPTTTHGRELSDADAERLAAEFDEERPGRRLSHRVDLAVNLWCFLVALFVLKQVFFPLTQGSQYYLVIFLAVTLPLAFVCYRFRASQHDPVEMLNATERNDNPGIVDWALAALTLVVGLYPILPIPESSIGFGGYEGFLDRQGSLLTLDVDRRHAADGAGPRGHPPHHRTGAPGRLRHLLRLRLLRRLPADRLGDLAHRPLGRADRERALQRGQRLLRCPARRRGDVHRAVHHLRRGPGADGRRPVLRGVLVLAVPQVRDGPRTHRGDVGLPARHRVRIRYGDRGDARLVRLADPQAGRLPEGVRRRHAGRLGHRRDPVAAHDGRRGVHHRGVPQRLLHLRARLGDRPHAALLPRHLHRRRDRRPPLRRQARRAGHRQPVVAAGPVRLPLHQPRRDRLLPRDRRAAVQGGRLRHRDRGAVRPARGADRPADGGHRLRRRRRRTPNGSACTTRCGTTSPACTARWRRASARAFR